MKKALLVTAIAAAIVGAAGLNYPSIDVADLPSQHSVGGTNVADLPSQHSTSGAQTEGLPSQHSTGGIQVADLPSQHSIGDNLA